MSKRWFVAVVIACLSEWAAPPAHAAVVSITQAKVNQGGITPGDAPGFPVTISRPGSYRLDTNLDFPGVLTDKNGIEIRANDVTIDFNGYRLQGNLQGQYGIEGKQFDTAWIRNGLVAGFKNHGIEGRHFWTIENMRVLVNGGSTLDGVHLQNFSRVHRSTIAFSGIVGVYCETSCHVEGNIISKGGYGVRIGSGTVLGNTISDNSSYGIIAVVGNTIGYGNNSLFGNNGGAGQVTGPVSPLQPNVCRPRCL